MSLAEPIAMLDLAAEARYLGQPLREAIEAVLASAQFIGGPNVTAFEREFAAYLGVPHAVSCNSGTDALILALRALEIGPGAEVITTAFTFFATVEAIVAVGATPILVDICPATFNLDPALVERAVTSRTRAIIPVHLFGHAAAMSELTAIAQGHGLRVIEDVAQAFGGRYDGRLLGTCGNVSAFSFFPSKNLGAYGDGGMATTADAALAETMRALRAHGGKKKYQNEMWGYNSRLDELQAAILRIKLPLVDDWNRQRRAAAAQYNEQLAGIPGLTLPTEQPNVEHVYHQYTLRIGGGRRDAVQAALAAEKISTMVYYPRAIHQLPVWADRPCPPLPHSEAAAASVLSLPLGPFLTAEQIARISAAVRQAMSPA